MGKEQTLPVKLDMNKKISVLVVVILLAICASLAVGLAVNHIQMKDRDVNLSASDTDNRFLKTKETEIVNQDGEKVYLRGVNAGGLFVQEEWMCPTSLDDHLRMIQTLTARFGYEKSMALIEVYESNWWTEKDFDNVKSLGFNLIRLPFAYFNLEDENGELTRFERMDWFIDECDERDIYVILDLHGAYGSQNGKDHSGDTLNNDLFTSEENVEKTIALWETVARRYKDRSIVAGYDILNEPEGVNGYTNYVQWNCFDEIYTAIRAVDSEHIIIMESVWEVKNLPTPSVYDWENVVYEYHNYCWDNYGDYGTQKDFVDKKIDDYERAFKKNYHNVPIFIGEWTGFTNADVWKYTIDEYNHLGLHWSVWTYKVALENNTWGFMNVKCDKVDLLNDSYEEIERKWSAINTENCYRNEFVWSVFKAR